MVGLTSILLPVIPVDQMIWPPLHPEAESTTVSPGSISVFEDHTTGEVGVFTTTVYASEGALVQG
ncbi:hypothetical protein GCM10027347_44080 [Larkinella harenae]